MSSGGGGKLTKIQLAGGGQLVDGAGNQPMTFIGKQNKKASWLRQRIITISLHVMTRNGRTSSLRADFSLLLSFQYFTESLSASANDSIVFGEGSFESKQIDAREEALPENWRASDISIQIRRRHRNFPFAN